MEAYESAKELLKKYGQEHLLVNYENLSDENKKRLLGQIAELDFEQVNRLFNTKDVPKRNGKIEPIGYTDKAKLSEEEIARFEKIGSEKIRSGKFAALTKAGGQGTRLGHNGPKGTYMLDVKPKSKPIFELLCESLKKEVAKYNVNIPWYIMTSIENNDETIAFFEKNNYFGYNKEDVMFFMQSEIPMVDVNGKILLTEEGLVKRAADGHGGVFESMHRNGVVSDMHKRNIEWIFISGVDNPLAKAVDELAIGMGEERRIFIYREVFS